MLNSGFARRVRLSPTALCLFLIASLPGCGGEAVDFSKPTAKPGGTVATTDSEIVSESQLAAGPAKTATSPNSASDQAATSGEAAETTATASQDKTASRQAAAPVRDENKTAKPADVPASLPARKVEFDEAWLANRDQVTSFSDDGSLVAVGGADGRLRLFDVAAGAVRDVFRTQDQSISQVIVSPDNSMLAAVTADGQLRLHSSDGPQGFDRYSQSRLATGIGQRGIGVHSSRVAAGAWQPQGQLLATAASDASIHLWEMPLRDAVELSTAGDEIVAVTVNSENDVVATVTLTGQVRLLDFADHSILKEFLIEDAGTVTQIALVSSSDTVLLGTQDGTILAYSSLRGEEIARLTAHQGEVTCLTVAADGQSFLTADSIGQLRLWKLPLSASSQLARFDAEIDDLKVTDDRRHAAALVRGRGLSIVRLTAPPVIRPVSGRSDDLSAISFVRSGSVLVGGARSGVVRFWSVPDGELIAETAAHNGPIRDISAHPRDLSVATAGEDGRIRLLEVPTRLPQIRKAGGDLAALSSSVDGLLLTACDGNGQVRLWHTVNGTQAGQVGGLDGRATAHVAGRDWIAVGDESGAIRFLKSDSIQPSGSVLAGNAAVTHLAIDDRSASVFAVDADGVIRELALPPDHPRSVKLPAAGATAIASVDGGRRVAVAGNDRKLLLIDTAGDKPASKPLGELLSAAVAVAGLDDGSVFITGHPDGSIEVIATGQAALRFDAGSTAAVRSVSANSQTGMALSAHQDGTVREWDLRSLATETPVEVANAELAVLDATGKVAAVATKKKTVELLRLADGEPLHEAGPFENSIAAMAWEADGAHLLLAETDGTIRRVDADTGQELNEWKVDVPVTALIGLPQAGEFLVGLDSGVVQRWSNQSGMKAVIRPASNAPIRQFAVGSNGALLILAGQQAEHWNLASSKKVGDVSDRAAASVAFAADGQTPLLGEVSNSDRTLATGVWNTTGAFRVSDSGSVAFENADGTVTHWQVGGRLRSAAAAGGRFAVVTDDGRCRIHSVPLRRTLKAPSGTVLAVSRNAKGDGILAVTSDGQLVRWTADAESPEVARTLNAGSPLDHAALADDGSVAAAVAGSSVFVWVTGDAENSDNVSKPITLPSTGVWLKLNRQGTRLLAGLQNGEVWLIDTAHQTLLERLPVSDGDQTAAGFTGNGNEILAIGGSPELTIVRPSVRRILAVDAKNAGDIGIAAGQLRVVGNDGATRCWGDDAEPAINRAASDGEAARLTMLSGDGEWVAQIYGESSVGIRRVRDGLESTLFTVEAPIQSFAISYDGQLAAIGLKSEVRIVDHLGNPMRTLEREQPAQHLTFIGQRSALAISRGDGSIDFSAFAQTEQELKIDGPVTGVAYDSSAAQLASWDERRVRLWNLASGEEQLQFDEPSTPILQAGFADGDQLLAGISQDGRVYVWSLAERKLRNQFAGPTDPRQAVIATDGSAIVIVRQSGQLETYSLRNGQLLEACNRGGANVQSVDLRADNLAVFTGGRDGQITERSLSVTASIAAHGTQRVTGATFSSRNGFLLSCGEDGTAALHQSEGRLVRRFEGASGEPVGVAESPDGSLVHVVSATEDAGELTTWKLADASRLQQIPLAGKPDVGETVPGLLSTVSRSGQVQMIDTATGHPTERIATVGRIADAAIAATAEAIVVAGTDGGLRVYPFNLVASLSNPGVATSIDWSADGRFLAAGTLGQISIWDVEAGSLAAEVPVGELPPVASDKDKEPEEMKAAPKTEFRVKEVGDDDDAPRPARKTESEEPIIDQGPRTHPPGTLASQVVITPRGELCGAFHDGSVRVWSLQEAARPGDTPIPHTIFRHPSPVLAIAVDALGERVACGCEDSNIWVWDVATGQELARFSGHRGAVLSLAFEVSGQRLFSTGADRAAKVWPMDEGKPGSRVAVEIAMASTSQELRRTLEKQLKTAERPEDRTRLRNVIRTLERGENSDGDSADTSEGGRISQLRAALRETTSGENRESMRRDLLAAIKEQDLVKQLTGTANKTERERLQDELKELNRNGYVARQLNSDQPVGRIAETDRQFAAFPDAESQKSVLRDKLQDMLRETPIWPRTRKDTWSRDESHLLASLPTEFNFDANLRPVELALTADGLTLAAARESARLDAPKTQTNSKNGRRTSDDDDEEGDATGRRAYGVVRVWDVLTGTELRAWTDVEGSTVRSVQFSGSGDTVFTAPDLFAFRLSTGESRELARNVSLAAGTDSQFAAVGLPGQALEMADAVRLVDLDSMQFLPLQVSAYEATVPAVALSNDGTTLIAAIRERARHRLVEFDARTLKQHAVLEDFEHRVAWYDGGEPGITYVAFSHDDRYVVAYGAYGDGDYRLTAIQMANRKMSVIESDKPLVRKDSAVPFRFVGNRGRLVVDTPTGLNVVDMSDSRTIDEVDFKSLPGGTRLLTLSADGAVAAFGDESGVITLRKLGAEQGRVEFQAHAGPVVGIAFSQGDRMLVTAGEEYQIRIWSLAGFLHSRQPADPVEKSSQTGVRRNRR